MTQRATEKIGRERETKKDSRATGDIGGYMYGAKLGGEDWSDAFKFFFMKNNN